MVNIAAPVGVSNSAGYDSPPGSVPATGAFTDASSSAVAGWHGNQSVLGTGESGAESLWSRIDFFDAEQGETDTRAADIDDRIDRANLVEMHVIDRRSVDFASASVSR